MGVYCFKISDHGVQHKVTTLHIVSEADLIRIHTLSSSNKCILPRSTHTHLESECENEISDSRNDSSSATRGSQEFTCNIPLQAVYMCVATVCVPPYSLVIGTQSSCTVWYMNDNKSGYQWAWDYLLTPCIGVVTPAANLCGACNSRLRP